MVLERGVHRPAAGAAAKVRLAFRFSLPFSTHATSARLNHMVLLLLFFWGGRNKPNKQKTILLNKRTNQ